MRARISERTVGRRPSVAARGFDKTPKNNGFGGGEPIKATGGHGGPPLQYVRRLLDDFEFEGEFLATKNRREIKLPKFSCEAQ